MSWTKQWRASLEAAIDEAEVLGVRLTADRATAEVLLHVLALPEAGPIDRDPRRILQLTSPGELRFVLRGHTVNGLGETLPLADLAAVEEFFDGLSWSWAQYGGDYFDSPTAAGDRSPRPSLVVRVDDRPRSHCFHWFAECGVRATEFKDACSFLFEGDITFDDLRVLRADGTVQPTQEFVDDADRWWDALFAGDRRLSARAQQAAAAGAPSWRAWALVPAEAGRGPAAGKPWWRSLLPPRKR